MDQTIDCRSRREFINLSLKGVGAIALGSFTVNILTGCSEEDSPTGPSDPGGNGGANSLTVDLTLPENQPLTTVGGTLALGSNVIDSQGILLYRQSADTVLAFSRRCTHQGCTTGAFNNGVSSCPCHGSRYNTSGQVIQGPAPAPLPQYQATLDGENLIIEK